MIYEIIGWIGTVLVLGAYLLLTLNKIKVDSKIYQLLNVFGSLALITNGLIHRTMPSVAINFFWILIAFYGLYNSKKNKK